MLQVQCFHFADAPPTLRCQQEPSYEPAALLRGGISNFFSVPPRFASLLLLSLAISASSPSLTRKVFSLMPVNFVALSSNLSSMLRVVLINSSVCQYSYVLVCI